MTQKTESKIELFDQPSSLMLQTIELLKERKLLKVYVDTQIPFYWLRKFKEGAYKNPSVNRVQHLHEYLTGKQLISK